ncbi:hypothetical protein JUM41_25035 [Rhizobium pusense]|uniref:TetR/AcrR family transcriptional regulator n=1 Tax=Agrobacterium pusense TaxID=648995 RepID=UPI001FCD08C8|nr:TetR/AcrR family transcriptional regulator [Agrobacterium pusense]MCJ2877512.1 hypothetical protein [Agrobacterium pusense]
MANAHDKRMEATAGKLRAALDRLLQEGGQRSIVPTSRLTVAALAREAGVARNAIYSNHRDILDDLNQARRRHTHTDQGRRVEDKISEQRSMMDEMQAKIRQLVTENAGLMRRAIEAERRADRAERRSALLTKEVDTLRRPTLLRPPDG